MLATFIKFVIACPRLRRTIDDPCLFAFADDAKTSYEKRIELVTVAEESLAAKRETGGPPVTCPEGFSLSKELLSLAKSVARYGMTIEEYKSKDIDNMVAAMASPLFAKVTSAQIPSMAGMTG